jgi:hypothetical protein
MESLLSVEEIERIARITHQVNKAFCEATGDDSQPEWEDAPDWQKESAMNGIIHAANHTAQSGGSQINPEASHNSWMSHKLREGWRYGPVKNSVTKEHPCLLPWEELGRDDRLKDVLFGGIVHFYSVFREEKDAA